MKHLVQFCGFCGCTSCLIWAVLTPASRFGGTLNACVVTAALTCGVYALAYELWLKAWDARQGRGP